MKFLQNEKLAQLTADITDVVVGTGERVINGRIEAFSMKRAGTDKKLAHELGERYQAEMQVVDLELAQFQNTMIGKRRSESIGEAQIQTEVKKRRNAPPFHKRVRINTTKRGRSNSVGTPLVGMMPKSKETNSRSRSRSDSFVTKSILKTKTETNRAQRSRSDSFVSNSSVDLLNSPLGDFHDSSTQRLMTDLILTLNTSFPDYDFSNIRPSHFARLPSPNVAISRTNERLSELTSSYNKGTDFFRQLWNAIDDVIGVNESEVYSYVPPQRDDDDDPMGFLTQTLDGEDSDQVLPLWTLNFFFVNKSMKRIVLFTCAQTMRNEISASNDHDGDHEFTVPSDEGKESFNYGNYTVVNSGFRSRRLNSTFEENNEDDEDYNWNDFDVDTDLIGQPAPSTTVA